MKVRQIMTPHAQCVATRASLIEAAQIMQELDVGCLPVCDGGEVVGIITDRDIVVRAIALGRDPANIAVENVMTPGVVSVYDDEEAERAAHIMEQHQVRRLPVLHRDQRLAGIVSLGDLAVETEADFSGTILREVSTPSAPVR